MNRNCRVTVSALLALAFSACGGGGGGGDDGGPPTGPPSNESPTADLSASPSSGNAPLEVSIDLSCSDPDGSIQESRLDADGDGSLERTSSSASIQVDTTYREEETVTVAGQCVDNDGAESSKVTRDVSVEVITRTVQVSGASPEPGEGLVPLAGAYVITGLQGETARDTFQTNAEGEAVIEPVEETGTYEVVVRDELGEGLGEWHDIASSDTVVTVGVTGDTSEEYALFPVVPLAAGDTFYENNLDFYITIQGNDLDLTGRSMPNHGQDPYKMFITTKNAPSQDHIDALETGYKKWNGTNQDFGNVTIIQDSAQADYITRWTDGRTGVDRASTTVSISQGFSPEDLRNDIGPHEFSHVLFNLNEDNSGLDLYCSRPAICPPDKPDDLELRTFEAAKSLLPQFSRSHSLLIYASE